MLIVRSAHWRVQHNGVKEMLCEVRPKYWIVQGRSLVRAVIHKCVTCKCFEGKPFSFPPAPPLPSFWVIEAPPFTYMAVDFAGPMYVGRKKGNKLWICLFTCCVTRAIHPDLVLCQQSPFNHPFKDSTPPDCTHQIQRYFKSLSTLPSDFHDTN